MSIRSPLLSFIFGGLLIALGVTVMHFSWQRSAASQEPQRGGTPLKSWSGVQQRRQEPKEEEEEETSPTVAMMQAGALILAGLGLAFPPLVKWVSESSFKEASLEVPEEGAGLGGNAMVRVRLVPGQTLKVASAELRLISEEQAIYTEEREFIRSNDDNRYQRKVMEVHRWTTRLPVPQDLSTPFEMEVPVPISRELPPTFNWERHMARTRLELEVELLGRVNLHLEKELHIASRLAPGAEA